MSDLCDEHTTHVNTFYYWLKVFFENGAAAFQTATKPKATPDPRDRTIEELEAKLVRKNEVVAELLEAHTLLKKVLGTTDQDLGAARHPRRRRRLRADVERQE